MDSNNLTGENIVLAPPNPEQSVPDDHIVSNGSEIYLPRDITEEEAILKSWKSQNTSDATDKLSADTEASFIKGKSKDGRFDFSSLYHGVDDSDRTSSTGTRSRVNNLWTKVLKKSDIWEQRSDITDNDEEKVVKGVMICVGNNIRWLVVTLKTAFTSPFILLVCTFIFIALSAAGIIITNSFDNAQVSARRQTAIKIAEQTDIFFQRILERAFVPLFTMAQFVHELPVFHDMPFYVGDRCAPSDQCKKPSEGGPAPPLFGKEGTHRNLTGIFERMNENPTPRFEEIASKIKKNSGLGKALVSIQLVPNGVVSEIYPMVNCEDFEDGYCLNNSGAWGLDLLNNPLYSGLAEATVTSKGVVTAGPLNLFQGGETFIARLAINMEGHSIVVDEVDYPCWGFVTILLNWKTLKDDSDIYEIFEREGMQFMLTRTDIIIVDGVETRNVKVIAESEESHLLENNNITLDLDTSDNNWVMSVGYSDGWSPKFSRWAYPLTFSISFLFTFLTMLVLVSEKEYEKILLKLLPRRVLRKLRKGRAVVEKYNMVTIFFSDIVGYTKMSTEMTPVEIMQMLNELFSEFDILAAKYQIFRVETVGDAYVAVGGCPKKCSGPEAAEKVAMFALDAIQATQKIVASNGSKILIRAGLASGPVVGGVIGSDLPKYTLFGDTVNFASRMESTSEPLRLQIAPTTQRLLLDAPNYRFECEERYTNGERGVNVKGKGRQNTYWVNSCSTLPSLEKATNR